MCRQLGQRDPIEPGKKIDFAKQVRIFVMFAAARRVRGDVWMVRHYGVTSLARKDYLATTLGFSQRSWSSERLHCPRMESTRTMPQCRPRFRHGASCAAQPRI